MYDLENGSTSTNAATSILSGSGSSGISADTLFALSQLKLR
jgi:hypothetical protein